MIMYGRSSFALKREIESRGIKITLEECEGIINNIARTYSSAWSFLESNAASALENEYLENAFGRRRWFTGISYMSEQDKASVRREAKNSYIQGTVADLLTVAGTNFRRYRKTHDLDFRILLPVHDAFLFDVEKERLEEFKKVIVECMCTNNKLPGTNYNLQADISSMYRWGEH